MVNLSTSLFFFIYFYFLAVFSKAKTLLLSSNNEQNQSNEQFNNQQSQQSVATASNTIEPVIQYNLPPQENGTIESCFFTSKKKIINLILFSK